MMTFQSLLAKSLPMHNPEVLQKVAVKNLKAKKRRSNGNPAIVAQVYSKGRNKDGSKKPVYDAVVEGMMGEGSKVTQRYVSVACSCDAFMYNNEYALAKRGASQIRYSNGQPPTTRNPRELPYTCKHLVALMREIAAKGL